MEQDGRMMIEMKKGKRKDEKEVNGSYEGKMMRQKESWNTETKKYRKKGVKKNPHKLNQISKLHSLWLNI